jgi:phthiocerol/phenolphthiocerol synthesis type-I polyketide synthase E
MNGVDETVAPDAAEEGGEAIAVVGLAGRFPGAADVAELWRNLQGGVESISRLFDQDLAEAGVDPQLAARPQYVRAAGVLDAIDRFDARFFGFSAREAELLDPQQRLFLETCWHALEDAGCDPGRFAGRIGVFAGSGLPAYLVDHVARDQERLEASGRYLAALSNDKDFLATRVSYKLDLRGPSLSVQTACSTSLVAVCLACQSLAGRECDAALAGGVSLRLPHRAGYLFQEEGILSPDGHCRAFDAEARGTVPSSGVGVVVLKRLADALADGDVVHAVVRGWALNNDGGDKAGFTAPRAGGQAEAVLEALLHAGVDPATVGYVEAHGTGTRLGDPIEVQALRRAFADAAGGPLPRGSVALGSLKSNLGHLDAAAGVAGLIKAVLALSHRQIPPSLHFQSPNPELGLDEGPFYVNAALADWPAGGQPRRAGVSSFGIGGTNAHVVLEEAPAVAASPAAGARAVDPGERHLLVLSAASAAALDAVSERLVRHLEEHPELAAADVAFTLQAGRRPLAHRRAVVVRDLADGAAALRAGEARRVMSGEVEAGHRPVAFLLPGQGSQHPGMGVALWEGEPTVRQTLERAAAVLAPFLGGKELRRLLAEGGDAELAETSVAQPVLFALEVACARMWAASGVQPEALLGHSVGELAAACLAGVFSFEDGLVLAAERGRLLGALPGGAMLSVPLGEAEVLALVAGDGELALAAVNAPGLCTVSGPEAAVARLAARLEAEGRPARRLHTSHAFHSAMVEPAVAPFGEVVARLALQPPRIPFLSNVTGTWITDEQATDAGYWARHLRAPVRFFEAAAELLAEPRRVLLEVGPGTALASLVRRQEAARGRVILSTLPHPQDPASQTEAVLAAAGGLWVAGVPLAPMALGERPARRVQLPLYPFERERYWIDAQPAGDRPAARGPVRKKPDLADWFYLPSFQRTLPSGALSRRAPEETVAPVAAAPEEASGAQIASAPVDSGAAAAAAPAESGRSGWLLLAGSSSWGAALAERLAARLAFDGEPVVMAAAGVAFEHRGPGSFAVRPGSADDIDALLATLAEEGDLSGAGANLNVGVELASARVEASSTPTQEKPALIGLPGRVVLLAGAQPPGGGTAGPVPTSLLDLLHLTHGLGRHLQGKPMRIALVTEGLWDVVGGEVRAPDQAAAVGLARVIPQEHPNLRCRVIDVASAPHGPDVNGDSLGELAERLAAELADDAAANASAALAHQVAPIAQVVALRGGHRWEQLYTPVRVPAAGPRLRQGGRYLITGGLGRLGLMLADHLARSWGARLTLVDRRGLDEVGEEAARRLTGLMDEGAEVVIERVDVTDQAAVAACVQAAVGRWGGIDGVVHAAGEPAEAYATLGDLQPDNLARHLGPKVAGARALRAALAGLDGLNSLGRQPDFVLAVSSMAPVLGGLGLGPFAAADATLDALARAWGAPWCSVGWEGWVAPWEAGDGIAFGSEQGALTMTPEEVVAAFERCLAVAGTAQLVIGTGDLNVRLAQWSDVLAATQTGGGAGRTVASPSRAPSDPLERRVAEVWQEVLGGEAIGAEDDFFQLGGNSLAGLQILSKLRAEFAVELPLKTFFESRTVAGMAAEIAAERERAAGDEERLAALLAEIEALSADEVTSELAAEGEAS